MALSNQGERAFSASLVYLGIGGGSAVLAWALGIRLPDPVAEVTWAEHITEITVILALFATGMRLDRPLGVRPWRSTIGLLAVVMPITIALVVPVGVWGMGLSVGAAVVLAAALAPTDPVLAGDLGTGPPGTGEGERRFALTSEAGLNDGLAFPVVLLGIVLVQGGGGGGVREWLVADVLYAVPVGIAVGAAIGWALARLTASLRGRGLMHPGLDGWVAVGATLVVYGSTELVGAYGFLAAFAGGIAFRRRERDHEYVEGAHTGALMSEKVAELATILLLGAIVTVDGLQAPGAWGWALIGLLLFVIRPVASLVGLIGTPLTRSERAYVGWFGVRGVGSLYYAAAAVGAGVLAPGEAKMVAWTAIGCVVASVVLHGVTGGPITTRADRAAQARAEEGEVSSGGTDGTRSRSDPADRSPVP